MSRTLEPWPGSLMAKQPTVRTQVPLHHPDHPDVAFLYGTILSDGRDRYSEEATANICVFADRQVDRSPTGSGVIARIALQVARGLIEPGQSPPVRERDRPCLQRARCLGRTGG